MVDRINNKNLSIRKGSFLMPRKSKYSAKEKYKILMEHENGMRVINRICHKYGIDRATFQIWRYKYNKYGIEGLRVLKANKKYSKELKEKAVKEYLSGESSLNEIVRKYEISSKSVVLQWITRYNSHRELTATGKGMNKSMTKGRTTTWKERLEIVLYCKR
jgi:transposase-like protein